MNRALRLALLSLFALLVLGPRADACPYCALSQGSDTLIYILMFLVIPYVIVTGVWFWMKRVIASEHE